LIQDKALYHRGAKMKAFFEENKARITVFQLPSYSPDFNPIEKLWKKIKEYGVILPRFYRHDYASILY
jgi:transposase